MIHADIMAVATGAAGIAARPRDAIR